MNILPQPKKNEIGRGHKMRIFITSFWAIFFTMIICGVILLPDYIIGSSKLRELRGEKGAPLEKADEADIVNAPRIINQKAVLVLQSAKSISVASRVSRIAAATSSGVAVAKISYDKSKIVVLGKAPNRDSLSAFKDEVDAIDFVEASSVPVGDFAKDKDLSFTMTIIVKGETNE